jgi:hypothetical protein
MTMKTVLAEHWDAAILFAIAAFLIVRAAAGW